MSVLENNWATLMIHLTTITSTDNISGSSLVVMMSALQYTQYMYCAEGPRFDPGLPYRRISYPVEFLICFLLISSIREQK